jgi:hypothetical protein
LGQFNSWVNKMETAATPIQDALNAGIIPDQSDVNTFGDDDAALMGTAYRIKLKDPPPACFPAFRSAYLKAMNDATYGGSAGLVLVGDLNRGDLIGADAAAALVGTSFTQVASDLNTADSTLTAKGW